MKASEDKLNDFLNKPNTRFIIPVYQRNYDWQYEQCYQLFLDLENIISMDIKEHFIGSIVYIKSDLNDEDIKELVIIDGQQRITTIILLLLAIYELLEDDWDKSEIYENYLILKRASENNKLKLKPIKEDNEVLKKLINNKIEKEDEYSNIYRNYSYLKEWLQNSKYKAEKFYKAIKRLSIVYIELNREYDDPQKIFESINSTGLSLSEADLIRNYILMDKKPKEQEELFENYWHKIEKILKNEKDYKVSEFIRDYLTLKRATIANKSNVYFEFKKFVTEINYSSLELLKELLYYAEIYQRLIFDDRETDEDINDLLNEYKILNSTVINPFLLYLFEQYNKKLILKDELINILTLIRNYLFRRLVCEQPTGILNRLFMNLHKRIKNCSYKDIAIVLIEQTVKTQFPKSNDFRYSFISKKDMYKFKYIKYLFQKLEHSYTKEKIDLYNITIEHIMPQKLTNSWSVELGDKFKEVHEQYIDNIGNLTITGYNSELSNKSFVDKKVIFKNSNLSLNKYFELIQNWNKEAIEKRAKELFSIADKVWAYPNDINLQKEKIREKEAYNLDDDVNVTKTSPRYFELFKERVNVSSWRDFLIQVSKKLYEIDDKIFESLLNDKTFKDTRKITKSENDFGVKHIANGIYIYTNLSAEETLLFIKILCEKFDITGDELVYHLS